MTTPRASADLRAALEKIVKTDQIEKFIEIKCDPAGNTMACVVVDGPCAVIARAALSAPAEPAGEVGMIRLSASEQACYRWPEDTAEHRAMRAAYMDGAVSYTTPQPAPSFAIDLEAMADAIDLARYQPPEHPRERPRPFSGDDRGDREYATRLAKAAIASLSPPSQERVDGETITTDFDKAIDAAAKAIPDNWCDSLLTGAGASKVPLDCPGVEKLLRGVTARIRALRSPASAELPSVEEVAELARVHRTMQAANDSGQPMSIWAGDLKVVGAILALLQRGSGR